MRLINVDKGSMLAEDLLMADHFLGRAKGLLGKRCLPQGQAMLLRPCRSIHTFGMLFPIDAVFLDQEGHVVGIMEAMPPFRWVTCHAAYQVVELEAGKLRPTGTGRGDRLAWD